MQASVLSRIRELGGSAAATVAGAPIDEQLAAVTLRCSLYDSEWEAYGVDELVLAHRDLYQHERARFFDEAVDDLLSDVEKPRGQAVWTVRRFTPLREGTADHDEWWGHFQSLPLSEIRALVGGGVIDFAQVLYRHGWPDHSYVCLQDPNPENPTVFGTDHEEFFRVLTVQGTLGDVLDGFLDRRQLRALLSEYLDGRELSSRHT